MEGRWTVFVDADGEMAMREEDDGSDHPSVPVVPCDDAAIKRAIEAVNRAHESKIDATWRELLTVAFRAAGETP